MHTMVEETRSEGTIGFRMYWKYFRAGANVIMLVLLVLVNLLAQVKGIAVLLRIVLHGSYLINPHPPL